MSRIVRIHEYGDASVLRIEDVAVPAPAADEVQIAVKAIGINRAEVMFRNHAYLQKAEFPSRLGYEAAGTVVTVGVDVTGFAEGEAVSVIPPLDIARWGTYGEVANVPARLVVKHPAALSFEEAAAVWMQYVTAWGALVEQAKLGEGDFVIVTAASSSVGLAAFQIARMVGATVIATTRTGAKRQALIDAGAHHVVATGEEDLVARVMEITDGQGARVVLDPVGGPSFEPLTESMARGGILLEYGALSGEPTMCPICDAYEAIDEAIAVLGDGPLGAREAMFLRTYSERVTLLHLGAMEDLDLTALRDAGVSVAATSLKDITLEEKVIVGPVGTRSAFDCLYLALGCEMQSRLAIRWGADHDDEANLIVDAHQRTSIDGLYAAGDVVGGLNQIAIATAEAAIAATDIHRRLRQIDHPPRA